MYRIFALLLCIFTLAAVQPVEAQPKIAKKLPTFSFFDLNGNVFTSEQLKYDKYLMVVYFDPDCDHCNEQAQRIVNSITKFKGVTMVWLSFGDVGLMREFKTKYFPNNKQAIFLHDPKMKLFDAFPDAVETPTIYVYNKNKTQIAKLEECEAKDIYQYFK